MTVKIIVLGMLLAWLIWNIGVAIDDEYRWD